MRQRCLVLFLVAAAGACGGGSTSSNPDAPSAIDAAQGGGTKYTLTWGPVVVPAGQEDTRCITTHLNNPTAMKVHSFHNVLGDSSHHLIVYRVTGAVENTTPTPCQPFKDTLDPAKGSPLMITQKKDEVLTLPDGVGYSFAANQQIRLEMHFINTTDAEQTLTSTAEFTTMDDAAFHDEADFLFIGSPDINIKAGTKGSVKAFFPMPPEYADSKYFAITGHEHKLGTNVTVNTATSATDVGTPVYAPANFMWAEPETVRHVPPFTVPANGGFNFQCDYDNTAVGAVDAKFGESANNEMCFFWAYYYPSHGAHVCFHTDQAGGHDICCPGNALCSVILGN
jgi:hypothetical protein